LAISACDSQLAQNAGSNVQTVTTTNSNGLGAECDEWNRTYELLTADGKEVLRKEGITPSGSDPMARSGYYVLAPAIMDDCMTRVRVGRFLGLVVGGVDTEEDRRLAGENSEQIVKVLRRVWNSPGFSADGTTHEKYLLLTNRGIKDADVEPFIVELLKTEELTPELLYVLLNRPFPSYQARLLELSSDTNDLATQIRALLVLQQQFPQNKTLNKLKTLSRDNRIPAASKDELLTLIRKLEAGKKITSLEIEDLDLVLIKGALGEASEMVN
jgi:hypothetical protein